MLFPKLQDRSDLDVPLEKGSALLKQLPRQMRHFEWQRPTLWAPGQPLTLRLIATACLTALFKGLLYKCQAVGYWMVLSSSDQKQKFREQQGEVGGMAGLDCYGDCCKWWRKWKKDNDWEGMPAEQKEQLTEQAALALFLNPPVQKAQKKLNDFFAKLDDDAKLPPHKSLVMNACLVVRRGNACKKHIVIADGYAQLELGSCVCRGVKCDCKGEDVGGKGSEAAGGEEAGSASSGGTEGGGDEVTTSHKVRVAGHVLVAWLFQGPAGARPVVCHLDKPARPLHVTWELQDDLHHPEVVQVSDWVKDHLAFPHEARCVTRGCVGPLCLRHSTQSQNAKTGSMGWQLPQRKANMKWGKPKKANGKM